MTSSMHWDPPLEGRGGAGGALGRQRTVDTPTLVNATPSKYCEYSNKKLTENKKIKPGNLTKNYHSYPDYRLDRFGHRVGSQACTSNT